MANLDKLVEELGKLSMTIKDKKEILRYDKRHLLIFGEYIPFEDTIPFFRKLTPLNYSLRAGYTSLGIMFGVFSGIGIGVLIVSLILQTKR